MERYYYADSFPHNSGYIKPVGRKGTGGALNTQRYQGVVFISEESVRHVGS